MSVIIKQKGGRTATGIPGFDELCEGGFVEDSLNLVMGNAGSGKTTFMMQYLYNGAVKFNQNGLYVSFEPEIADLMRISAKQAMDFDSLVKNNKITMIRANPNSSIKELQDKIGKLIVKQDIRRICIDPINVFSLSLNKDLNLRKQIYDFLSWLKSLDVCVLVAGESDGDSEGRYVLGDEIKFTKYAVDSVVELFSSGITGEGDRAVRISKMRETDHHRSPLAFEITNKGIKISKS